MKSRGLSKRRQEGISLIQVLLAILLGALTVTWATNTIVNGMEKGIATKTLTAVDALQQAKQQYLVDNPETDPGTAVTFANLQPYLMVMGTQVNDESQLMAGTGGRTITNYGSFNTGLTLSKSIDPSYVTPSMKPIVVMINNGLASGAAGQ
jgi:ABC-type lipoprotein release transport system permease subunit